MGHGVSRFQGLDRLLDVSDLPERQGLQILAPVIRKKKGSIRRWSKDSKDGYVRVCVDMELFTMTGSSELEKNKNNIDVVVDRIIIRWYP